MARVEVPITVLNSSTGLPVNGAAVQIKYRATGTNAPWFSLETGGTGSTVAVITDANGRVDAWVERGAYSLAVTGTGITPYTEAWDAVPGGDATIDPTWISDAALLPGELKMYGGSIIPSGWLLCDGSQVSRVTYARLWTAIGVNHGAGDGTSTFNLPDMRGRVPMGSGTGSGLTARTLGAKSGAETHSHTGNIPSHTHSGSAPDHYHDSAGLLYTGDHGHSFFALSSGAVSGTGTRATGGFTGVSDAHQHTVGGGTVVNGNIGVYGTTGGSIHGLSFTTGGPSATAFTTSTDTTVQPFTVVNFIIKT